MYGYWNHLVVRKDDQRVKWFVNGKSAWGFPFKHEQLRTNHSPLVIGNRENPDQGFNGLLDDIRIYNRALTDSEIAVLAGASTPKPEEPSQTSVTPSVSRDHQPNAESSRIELNQGLVGHWNFEEGKGTQVADVSGQNKHGTLENTDDSIWSREGPPSPHAAKASLILDGVDDQFTVPSATMLNGSEGMTVSVWLKPHTPRVFVELGSATRNAFGLLADGRFYVSTEENSQIDVVPDLSHPIGQWHHLAGRYDGQLMTVFRNGQPLPARSIRDTSFKGMNHKSSTALGDCQPRTGFSRARSRTSASTIAH